MRTRTMIGTLKALAMAVLITACGDPPAPLPTTPSGPTVTKAEISGPDTLAPGQSAQYSATLYWSDGRVVPALPGEVVFVASNLRMLRSDASGIVTALDRIGETALNALVGPSGPTQNRGAMNVVVVPEGTVRLTGSVIDAESSAVTIPNARIEVTPGSFDLTTNFDGAYKVYGVPIDAEVRITADGYAPFVERLRLTGHTTRQFPLTPLVSQASLAGNYTLSIDVVNPCHAFSEDLQHRTYDAVVTQNGSLLDVRLIEPRFRVNAVGRGNHFTGRVLANGAAFTLEYYDSETPPSTYPDIAERLTSVALQTLTVSGQVVMSTSAQGLSGQMTSGSFIAVWDAGFPATTSFQGSCSAVKVTLTPR